MKELRVKYCDLPYFHGFFSELGFTVTWDTFGDEKPEDWVKMRISK